MEELSKKDLRKLFLGKRRDLTVDEVAEKSNRIFSHLTNLSPYRNAKVIMCYAAMKDEVQTHGMLAQALAAGKIVCIPYIRDFRSGLMDAVRVRQLSDLTAGDCGILTVKTELLERVDPAALEFVVVPGVAFDTAGHRLGMGGGFYDRFLAAAKDAVYGGVAFSCQMGMKIPILPHDFLVDCIATEEGIINCKTGKM